MLFRKRCGQKYGDYMQTALVSQHVLFMSVLCQPWFGISPPKYLKQPRPTAF